MSCGCSSALTEDVTQQHSLFRGCCRKWGGTELVSFPQPIFLCPPQFLIAFVFQLYGLILSSISPVPIELAAVSTVFFLKLFTVAHKVIFPYRYHCLQSQPGLLALFRRQRQTKWPLILSNPIGTLSVNVFLHIYWFSCFLPTFKSQLSSDPFCTSRLI